MPSHVAAVGNPRMNRGEARDTLCRLREGLRDCRLLLLDLYEREGWRALGYASWRECCQTEFDLSLRHLYRLLQAAQVEKEVTHGSHVAGDVPIPERQLRELARLDSAELRREVWEEAQAQGHGESLALRRLVDQVLEQQPPPPPAAKHPAAAQGTARFETPPATDAGGIITARLRARALALRSFHLQLGTRARAADLALDAYVAVLER